MPSPLGHALGAIAAGWAVSRPAPVGRSLVVQSAVLGLAGILPDVDLLFGRHSAETHSLGAAALAATIALLWWRAIAATPRMAWLAIFCAWCSHPVLDALAFDTAPPIGVMIFWPFSTSHYQTGWAVFDPIRRSLEDHALVAANLRAIVREVMILGPVAAVIGHLRRR